MTNGESPKRQMNGPEETANDTPEKRPSDAPESPPPRPPDESPRDKPDDKKGGSDSDNDGDDDSTKPGGSNLYEEPKEVDRCLAPPQEEAVNHNSVISSDDDDDFTDDEDEKEPTYSNPPSNKPATSPPPDLDTYLYTVQATHKYTGEDVDELSFEPGEIIYVIDFENPEEQDDGWQMGVKATDGIKGVFPENFTQKV